MQLRLDEPRTSLWEVGKLTGTINHANKNMVTRTCDTRRPKICPNDTLDNITNHSFAHFLHQRGCSSQQPRPTDNDFPAGCVNAEQLRIMSFTTVLEILVESSDLPNIKPLSYDTEPPPSRRFQPICRCIGLRLP